MIEQHIDDRIEFSDLKEERFIEVIQDLALKGYDPKNMKYLDVTFICNVEIDGVDSFASVNRIELWTLGKNVIDLTGCVNENCYDTPEERALTLTLEQHRENSL